jgi:uncharacterized protein (TIGR03083 family)
MDLTRAELLDLGWDALAADPEDLPRGMGSRVLGAALARPRPRLADGWAAANGDLSSHTAFITTAAELCRLLVSLDDDDWTARTGVGGGASVRDLVLHLIGVERYVQGQLGRRPAIDAPRPEDHFPVLRAAAADLDGAAGPDVARAWWLEVLRLVGACAEIGPDHEIAYHHLAGSVRGMLVVRTFELWTHDDDIRRAVGLASNDLDERRLSLMSTSLVESLALGMALAGTTRPGRTARISLTGPGGGRSFDAPLAPGEDAGLPDIVVETSALDLCRLASNRLPVDRLDVVVDGDRSLLEPLLVGATAFAMD